MLEGYVLIDGLEIWVGGDMENVREGYKTRNSGTIQETIK